MKPTNVCLPESAISPLLSGDLPPDEIDAAENHLADCVTCRGAIESKIADARWWDDARHSLAVSATRNADNSEAAYATEPPTNEQMLELLGPTDDPAMLGRIGVYEIVGILGRGGMGVVFKGYDGSLGRNVAIKMLLPHLAASGAARKRFAREAQAAAAVVDDHVMAIHGVSEWKSVPYFVMPYARGVSLQKRLSDDGPLEVREVLRIAMQAAKGLAAAHAQGLVHRDVKPANIFLDEGVERVQLMDFGLARAVDDASLTRSGTLAGTPQYMSPEQARAETVDHSSDLFSLGSVLYAMCTGHAPFRAESSYSVLRLITDKEPRPIREINSDVPEWLCLIISKLMSKQASDRFDSAQQVASLLEYSLAHLQNPTTSPLPIGVQALAAGAQSSSTSTLGNRLKAGLQQKPPIRKLIAGAAFAISLIFAGVLIVLELNKGTLTIESEFDDVPIRIMQGEAIVRRLKVTKEGNTVRIAAGNYLVAFDGEFTNMSVVQDAVVLRRGETEIVKIVKSEVHQPTDVEKPGLPARGKVAEEFSSNAVQELVPDTLHCTRMYPIGSCVSEVMFRSVKQFDMPRSDSPEVNDAVKTAADDLIKVIENTCGPCRSIHFIPAGMELVVQHSEEGQDKIRELLEIMRINESGRIDVKLIAASSEFMEDGHEADFDKWLEGSSKLTADEVRKLESWSTLAYKNTIVQTTLIPGKPTTVQVMGDPVTLIARHVREANKVQMRLDMNDSNPLTTSVGTIELDGSGLILRQVNSDNFFWLLCPSSADPASSLSATKNASDVDAGHQVESRVVSYDIRHLVDEQAGISVVVQLKTLMDLIRETIEPDSWYGGPFSLEASLKNKCLVVRQTDSTHNAIAAFLDKLHERRAKQSEKADESKNSGVTVPPMEFDTLEDFLKPGKDLFEKRMKQIEERLATAKEGTVEHRLFSTKKKQLQQQWDLSIAQVKGMVAAAEAGNPVQLAPIVIPNNPTPWKAPLPDPLQTHDEGIADVLAGTWDVTEPKFYTEDDVKHEFDNVSASFSKNMLIVRVQIRNEKAESQYIYRISGDKIDLWDYDSGKSQTDRLHPMLGSFTLQDDTLRISHHDQEMEVGQPQPRPPVQPGKGLVYWEMKRRR